MNRGTFVAAALVFVASGCSASSNRSAEFAAVQYARERAVLYEVRHLGTLVGRTRDPVALSEALDAVSNAEPRATTVATEQSWQLTFVDINTRPALIVTSAAGAPFDGTIAGRRVLFQDTSLVRFLTRHYTSGDSPPRR